MDSKIEAFKTAQLLLVEVFDVYDLTPIRAGSIFAPITTTPIDQYIDHIIRVADWLLEPNINQ